MSWPCCNRYPRKANFFQPVLRMDREFLLFFQDRQAVGIDLTRMKEVCESINDGDGGMLSKLLDNIMPVRADDQTVQIWDGHTVSSMLSPRPICVLD